MAETLAFLSATGNRFALLDALAAAPGRDPTELAGELCGVREPALDALLLLEPPRAGGAVRMSVVNRDGSRAEACGNGLRCVALVALERGYASSAAFAVETDAGPRRVEVLERGAGPERLARVRVELGVPRIVALDETIAVGAVPHDVQLLELGNPHCVLFVRDPAAAPVTELGPSIERHVRFPRRTNVEFVAVRPYGLEMRVWERGVGETASCGTGAGAAAVCALLTDRARTPVEVRVSGGRLTVEWEGGDTVVALTGTVEEIA